VISDGSCAVAEAVTVRALRRQQNYLDWDREVELTELGMSSNPRRSVPAFSARRAVLQTVMTEVKKKGKIKTILKLVASNLGHDAPRGETMIGYSLGAAGIYFSLFVVQAIV
jgi:hypothetical protein